jgi:hypothetical protein
MNRANNLCTGTPRGIHRAGLTCVSVTPTTRILPPASYYYCTSPATVWYEYVLYGKSAGCLHLGCWPLSWLLRRAAIRRELHRSRHGLRGALIRFVSQPRANGADGANGAGRFDRLGAAGWYGSWGRSPRPHYPLSYRVYTRIIYWLLRSPNYYKYKNSYIPRSTR